MIKRASAIAWAEEAPLLETEWEWAALHQAQRIWHHLWLRLLRIPKRTHWLLSTEKISIRRVIPLSRAYLTFRGLSSGSENGLIIPPNTGWGTSSLLVQLESSSMTPRKLFLTLKLTNSNTSSDKDQTVRTFLTPTQSLSTQRNCKRKWLFFSTSEATLRATTTAKTATSRSAAPDREQRKRSLTVARRLRQST